MKHHIGIDLGTTNSVICTYNDSETRVWKSPEQNDVTPSAIYINRRGNKYIGKRAYDAAPQNPDNAATIFKRQMGTSTPIKMGNTTKTPEECSAEILRALFGYLPEEIRNDRETGTVITVPAAFNQMQKDATLQAANMAGIGNTALIQEPVAAVMSVVQSLKTEGTFLIFDLGGGTLDIAIAESMGGHVNLLEQGGIAMCGGRDFDRTLVDTLVRPWLHDNFNLPSDVASNPKFRKLLRLATWAAERSKIELSSKDKTVIMLSEEEVQMRDLEGVELYLDIPLSRNEFDPLIEGRIRDAIDAARSTLDASGYTPDYVEKIVFIGGPTNYKPLRDMVSFELGVSSSTDVNPMTAVAEGASLYAESIEWNSENRERKNSRGTLTAGGVTFNYHSRTPENTATIAVEDALGLPPGAEFQIDSTDTGWTSGRLPLKNGARVHVELPQAGDNTFTVSAADKFGNKILLEKEKVVITKTAATVDYCPASHSLGIEILEKIGGLPTLHYLVRKGDRIPHKDKVVFKAAESLKAGDKESLNFKLWEGEIEDTITDNRSVGVLKISGLDLDEGVIAAGADLECDYQIKDSGVPVLTVSIPSVGASFASDKSFYSRLEGQLDYTTAAALVVKEGEETLERIELISDTLSHPKLEQARNKAQFVHTLGSHESDAETTQEARENVLEARRLMSEVKKIHRKEIRQSELNEERNFFNDFLQEFAGPAERRDLLNLFKTAQNSIDRNDNQFEYYLHQMRRQNFSILWKQDWFVVQSFESLISSPDLYMDSTLFQELQQEGRAAMQRDDIQALRLVVAQLVDNRVDLGQGITAMANIVRG